MDSVFAIKGKDFVLIAADMYAVYSIMRLSDNDIKLKEIDGNKVMGVVGAIGDRNKFSDYVTRNMHLDKIRQGFPMSTHAAAAFSSRELAEYLRTNPFQVEMLLAGVDDSGPRLYWIDFLASMVELPKAAHGYAAYFILGLLDQYYKPDLTQEEALDICKLCVKELKTRFVVCPSDFQVKIVRKDGISTISL